MYVLRVFCDGGGLQLEFMSPKPPTTSTNLAHVTCTWCLASWPVSRLRVCVYGPKCFQLIINIHELALGMRLWIHFSIHQLCLCLEYAPMVMALSSNVTSPDHNHKRIPCTYNVLL